MYFVKNSALLFVSLFLLLFCSAPSFAERPFHSTETAVPTERGSYRVQGGLTLNRISEDRKKTQLDLNLRYGLIRNLEFELDVPYLFVDDDRGDKNHIGDLSLNTKIRFIKGRVANPLSIAGQILIKLPTAGENRLLKTSGVVDVGFNAIASKAFTPVTAHINAGYFFIGNPDGKDVSDQIRYALGLEFDVLETPITFIGELFGRLDTGSSSFTDDTMVAMGGFSIQTRKALTFDVSAGFGLNDDSPDYMINAGWTSSFD